MTPPPIINEFPDPRKCSIKLSSNTLTTPFYFKRIEFLPRSSNRIIFAYLWQLEILHSIFHH